MINVLISTVVGLILNLSASQVVKPAAPEANITPSWSLKGADSGIERVSYLRIRSDSQWELVWKRHHSNKKGTPARPKLDFQRVEVVAIFLGSGFNSKGVSAEVQELPESLRVRFDSDSYQTMGQGVRCTPFGMFAVPRTDLPLLLEENVQGLIGKPPIWRFRARISA